MEQIIKALTDLFTVLNTPLGVAALAIIAFGIAPKIPALQRYFIKPCEGESVSTLKPALTEIVNGMKKISGNDLSHIQAAVDALGQETTRRMDNFDDKLAAHDRQALEIKTAVDNIWATCRSHK